MLSAQSITDLRRLADDLAMASAETARQREAVLMKRGSAAITDLLSKLAAIPDAEAKQAERVAELHDRLKQHQSAA